MSTDGQAPPSSPSVYFVSLGCPKNQVDSEIMLGVVQEEGHQVVTSAESADTIVVNTCAFIESAKEESINTVLELARLKKDGNKKLIMTGCLSQRYSTELLTEMPEVDHFLGSSDMLGLRQVLRGSAPRNQVTKLNLRSYLYDHSSPRTTIGSRHSNFVKIAEGCDRPCAFCIIPKLRGPQRSRTVFSVVEEVAELVQQGTREICLVAQDLTRYGSDLVERGLAPATLEDLLDALCQIDSLKWIRLHYAYPTATTDGLIDRIAHQPKVASYFDVPLQHVDSDVLKAMRRGYGERAVVELVEKLRRQEPHIWLRTTLLVGHPGENDKAFQRLYDFVATGEIDHLGVFPWSKEEDTASAILPKRVESSIAQERCNILMKLQAEIRAEKQTQMLGNTLEVMIDGTSEESEYLLDARHEGQAPQIDGKVILCDTAGKPGQILRARVIKATNYDLIASANLQRPTEPENTNVDDIE